MSQPVATTGGGGGDSRPRTLIVSSGPPPPATGAGSNSSSSSSSASSSTTSATAQAKTTVTPVGTTFSTLSSSSGASGILSPLRSGYSAGLNSSLSLLAQKEEAKARMDRIEHAVATNLNMTESRMSKIEEMLSRVVHAIESKEEAKERSNTQQPATTHADDEPTVEEATRAVGAIPGAYSPTPDGGMRRTHGIVASLVNAVAPHSVKKKQEKKSSKRDSDADDDEDQRVESSDEEEDATKREKKMVDELMRRIRSKHGTFTLWYKQMDFKSSRNGHELRTICAALDAYTSDTNIDIYHDGNMHLFRRFVGLNEVEKGKKWSVAKAIEHESTELVPRTFLTHIYRQAAAEEKMAEQQKNSKWTKTKGNKYGNRNPFGTGKQQNNQNRSNSHEQKRGGSSSSKKGGGGAAAQSI